MHAPMYAQVSTVYVFVHIYVYEHRTRFACAAGARLLPETDADRRTDRQTDRHRQTRERMDGQA